MGKQSNFWYVTKVAHFVPVKTRYATEKLPDLYVEHVLRLHRAPRRIISNRGPQFVAKFWKSFHKLLGTTLSYNTAFHPQTDGQIERVNQVLEDIYKLVHSLMAQFERASYRLQSSLTTTTIKQVFGWHPLRPFMGGSA
jgi:transposase InsO family protein